jgi:hypothetical protein
MFASQADELCEPLQVQDPESQHRDPTTSGADRAHWLDDGLGKLAQHRELDLLRKVADVGPCTSMRRIIPAGVNPV